MTTSTETVTGARVLPEDAAGVLAAARARRVAADRAEADLLALAVQWAVIHPAESIEASETFRMRSGGEAPVGLAGPGAPLVAEFSVPSSPPRSDSAPSRASTTSATPSSSPTASPGCGPR